MRYLTLIIDDKTELTLDNSIWGKETVKLNGVLVSEKTSIWGSEHSFEVLEENKIVTYKVIIKMSLNIKITYLISRDGQEIFNDAKQLENGIQARNWVKSFGILIWIIIMIVILRNGASIAIPLAFLPILLSFSHKSNLVRNIDLTTSKSI